jgi:hypothetical protein
VIEERVRRTRPRDRRRPLRRPDPVLVRPDPRSLLQRTAGEATPRPLRPGRARPDVVGGPHRHDPPLRRRRHLEVRRAPARRARTAPMPGWPTSPRPPTCCSRSRRMSEPTPARRPAVSLFDPTGATAGHPTDSPAGRGIRVRATAARSARCSPERSSGRPGIAGRLADRPTHDRTDPAGPGRRPLTLTTDIERDGTKGVARRGPPATRRHRGRAGTQPADPTTHLALPTTSSNRARSAGPPDDVPPSASRGPVDDHVAFHKDACEHRFTEGAWDQPGPVGVWIRLLVDVVAGETPTGAQRAAAAADFGNGVSAGCPSTASRSSTPISPCTCCGRRSVSGSGCAASRTTAPRRRRRAPASPSRRCTTLDGRLGRSVQSLILDARS